MGMTYSIGIDIGGTNTDIGIVSSDGKIIDKENLHTNEYYDAKLYMKDTADKIKILLERNHISEIEGIGIGAPNGNTYTGSIDNAPNLNFKGQVKLAEMMKQHIDTKVVVSNDANAAAYGEMIYGGAKDLDHFITFTLGTGVGSGIIIDRKLILGSTSTAGELGHSIIIINGRQCGCGRKGCLEAYCSATGVARTARELLATTTEPSILRKMNPEDITSLDVSIAAGKGDKLANEIYKFTGRMLGEACADFAAFSSPEAFIFFGGMVKAGDLIMHPIVESYNEHVMPIFRGKAQFLVSGLDGASAAILGASAVGWEIQ